MLESADKRHKGIIGVVAWPIACLLMIGVSSGCSAGHGPGVPGTMTVLPTLVATIESGTPEPAQPKDAIITASPSPSASATQSPTPSVTATQTATPTPTLHPMDILAERQRIYPGSQITIEETLEPGANYNRYYAWYVSDGLKIYGLLTVPSGDKPPQGWPAIVFNHGYIDPRVYRTTERYVAYVDQLSRHGYIVYKIDYRGHDRSQGIASGAYGDPGYTTDVLNAVASLKLFLLADSQHIGMWGHSMGGFLTLRSMVISPDIKAGVIWAGVVGSYPDLICCWHHPEPGVPTTTPNPNFHSGWRTLWQDLYGSPAENPNFWMSISANSYLQNLSGPIQIHHDVGDSEVPVKFSQDLYQEVLSSGKTAEYFEYPGDDHNLANWFNLAMQRTIEFFDRYLK